MDEVLSRPDPIAMWRQAFTEAQSAMREAPQKEGNTADSLREFVYKQGGPRRDGAGI